MKNRALFLLFSSFFFLNSSSLQAKTLKLKKLEIIGETVMTLGPDPDTAFPNAYRLVAITAEGDTLTDNTLDGMTVTWDIDGFKTENDTEGQYCDSYGKFSVNGQPSLATTFELRNNPFNFAGQMTASLSDGKKVFTAKKYVTAIGLAPKSELKTQNSKLQTVEIAAETGLIYNIKVAYIGVLMCGFINEDLAGYELGRQEQADTVTYSVPCINGKIDLTVTAANGATPHIAYVSVEKQEQKTQNSKLKTQNSKPKVHHIGDSTSANKGSWAHRLRQLLNEGKYQELAELCDFCNDGAGGRNLCTYYAQGKLAAVLLDIQPGDIVVFGNNGTNGMGKTFEEDLNIYIEAVKSLGAKVMINSYTPHGAVSRWTKGYNKETQKFDSYRRDAYDVLARKIADERAKSDPDYIGFIEIGKNADAIFNAYIDDYKANGHETRDEAAQAIIRCFKDHNHYSEDSLACDLMLNGYKGVKGIVEQLVSILKTNKK